MALSFQAIGSQTDRRDAKLSQILRATKCDKLSDSNNVGQSGCLWAIAS